MIKTIKESKQLSINDAEELVLDNLKQIKDQGFAHVLRHIITHSIIEWKDVIPVIEKYMPEVQTEDLTGNLMSSIVKGFGDSIKESLSDNETLATQLFDELVPASGKADTVAGEIIRAVNRIAYRNWNDGDHIGCDYGNETCNAPARYLQSHTNKEIESLIDEMWGNYNDDDYDFQVDKLLGLVCTFVNENPELKETPNTTDMWSYKMKEDTEYDIDEDDEEY